MPRSFLRWCNTCLTACLITLTLQSSAQHSIQQSASSALTAAAPDHSAPQVKLRLTETVTSANAKVGQPVRLEVVEPVEINGKVIIAGGAYARGVVTQAKRRGHNRREGQLQLTIQTVSQVDGNEAILQAATVQKGSGHGEPIFGPCTFPIPADPAGLFRKGEDVVIPKGTELIAAIKSLNP